MILKENLSLLQKIAILFLMISIVLISYEREESPERWKLWIVLTLFCFGLWGIWAFFAKIAVSRIGQAHLVGSYALVAPVLWIPYWVIKTKGKFKRRMSEFKMAELSILCFCFGALNLYGALALGYVSVVIPLASLYPILSIAYARMTLKERLKRQQAVAVGLAIGGILLFSV